MEQIIKYKTSDGMEWDKRELAESHEKLLGLKNKIKEHRASIESVQREISEHQKSCNHELSYEPPEVRYDTRSECNGPDSDDCYAVKVIHTTYTCCICNHEWTHTRDV